MKPDFLILFTLILLSFFTPHVKFSFSSLPFVHYLFPSLILLQDNVIKNVAFLQFCAKSANAIYWSANNSLAAMG